MEKPFDEQAPFPDKLDIAVGTRLGTQDRLVQFDPPLPGPFGEPLQQLPVRSFLLPDNIEPDAQPSNIAHEDGTTEFDLGEARYRYSRLGLERLNDD